MAFEWDEEKREANLVKHGVDFLDLAALFDGPTLEIIDDRRDYGETRINCLGEIEGRVFIVTYTWRGQGKSICRRIISARKADDREQRTYYANVER